MNTHPKSAEFINKALIDLGYSQDVINLAVQEAKEDSGGDYTLEQILDLIVFRHKHYYKILNKGKAKIEDNIWEEDNNWKKQKGKKPAKNPVKIENQKERQPLEEIDNFERIEEEEEKGNKKEKLQMDEVSSVYLESIHQTFRTLKSKDPNWWILELSEQLKSLKFRTSEGAVKVMEYLKKEEGYYVRLENFKNLVFYTVKKVIAMPLQKKLRFNMEELELALANSMELGIFSLQQIQDLVVIYPKFCLKLMVKPNEKLVEKFQAFIEESEKKEKKRKEASLLSLELEKKEKEKEKEIEDEEDEDEDEDGWVKVGHGDKELCIICMERVREFVLLPCSHFLTCPLCSPRIMKCPVCSMVVEKHLKVYWA